MVHDPLYIDSKKYIELIEKQEEYQQELIKQGLDQNEGRKAAYARVRQGNVAEVGVGLDKATVGDGKSPGLDNGVSAANPFGG